MKNAPRLLLLALVVDLLLYSLFAIKRESFTGENGSGYNVGLQAPVSRLMAAGVVIVAGLVYMVLKKKEMNKQPTKSNILLFLSQEKVQFEKDFRITKIGLFGSYARGEETEDSDIDLLIEFYPDTENLTDIKTALQERIEAQFGIKVHLCREKYIKPYFRPQILQSAIIV